MKAILANWIKKNIYSCHSEHGDHFRHDFVYGSHSHFQETGQYVDGKPIMRKVTCDTRECKRCKRYSHFSELFGWL